MNTDILADCGSVRVNKLLMLKIVMICLNEVMGSPLSERGDLGER